MATSRAVSCLWTEVKAIWKCENQTSVSAISHFLLLDRVFQMKENLMMMMMMMMMMMSCWTNIPGCVHHTATLDSFKSRLKTHYFEKSYLWLVMCFSQSTLVMTCAVLWLCINCGIRHHHHHRHHLHCLVSLNVRSCNTQYSCWWMVIRKGEETDLLICSSANYCVF